MLDIVTWMWHDPHLQGSRGTRERSAPNASIRPDLVPSGRRLQRLVAKGKAPPAPPPKYIPAGPSGPPRFFKPEHVERLAEMFVRHLDMPHRFICITDEPPSREEALLKHPHVEWMSTPQAARAVAEHRSPEGLRFPSCYRRLWTFSHEAAGVLSERALVLDIDAIPVRDLTPIVSRTETFVGWRPYRDWGKQKRVGGGIYLMTPGAHTDVWNEFVANPQRAIQAARISGFRGSDQAWLSYKLASKVPVYDRGAGIYSIRDLGHDHRLPPDARLVQMNGPAHCKPWSYRGPATWVAEHWKGR